jgi:hypothetical protein
MYPLSIRYTMGNKKDILYIMHTKLITAYYNLPENTFSNMGEIKKRIAVLTTQIHVLYTK